MPQKDPSRTEKATGKRRKKARDEGNVPRSQEVSKTISIFSGTYALYFWLWYIAERMQILTVEFLSKSSEFVVTPQNINQLLMSIAIEMGKMLMPVLFVVGFLAYLVVRLQVGKLWQFKSMKFKFKNFNIINGFKRMLISPQTLIRLGKSLLQAIVIGFAPYLVIQQEMHNFMPLYYSDAWGISVYILKTAYRMVLYALLPMVIIALADLWYTRWDYEENLKMTKDEVKDERKQAEGDPVVKAKQKQKMMEFMMQRMMEDVPKADVVVTNPTHIAVAIRYNALEAPAPMVLAKGGDAVAERIKEIAREHNVPIRQNVPLARALYKQVEIGEMVPEELYKAIAAILATLDKFKMKAGP